MNTDWRNLQEIALDLNPTASASLVCFDQRNGGGFFMAGNGLDGLMTALLVPLVMRWMG